MRSPRGEEMGDIGCRARGSGGGGNIGEVFLGEISPSRIDGSADLLGAGEMAPSGSIGGIVGGRAIDDGCEDVGVACTEGSDIRGPYCSV